MAILVRNDYFVSEDLTLHNPRNEVFLLKQVAGPDRPNLIVDANVNITYGDFVTRRIIIAVDYRCDVSNITFSSSSYTRVESPFDIVLCKVDGGSVITNDGKIEIIGGSGSTEVLHVDGVRAVYFTNTGHLAVGGDGQVAALNMRLGSATNHGEISVHGDIAKGVFFAAPGTIFSNTGLLEVTGVSSAIGVTGSRVENAGEIRVSGNGQVLACDNLTVVNLGEIEATSTKVGQISYGAISRSVTNHGVMTADVVVGEYSDPFYDQHVFNYGEMHGDLNLGIRTDVVLNDGEIFGDVLLGKFSDSYSGSGRVSGAVYGGGHNDTLVGGQFGDQLFGDELSGGEPAGDDILFGGRGRDFLSGQGGQDTLDGGRGIDSLNGGAGSDLFVFSSAGDTRVGRADRVLDLEADDTIDLSSIDADEATSGDQAFRLVGSLTGAAGEAALSYDSARDRTKLLLDCDGDGKADAVVVLDGSHSAFDSFVL